MCEERFGEREAAASSAAVAFAFGQAALYGDPVAHERIENAERDFAAQQHCLMEAAQVEIGAQFIARDVTQARNLAAAKFVAASLAGPNDVAIDFGGDHARHVACGLSDVVDGLLA